MAANNTMRLQRHRDGPVQLAAARSARPRAYRARKHDGRITLPVEVDEAALAEGQPEYDDLERRLAEAPVDRR
jgi:hypothetical protein